MGRRKLATALVFALPVGLLAGCGDEPDQAAGETEQLDRELDLALQGDSAPVTFEDTAMAPPEEPTAEQPETAAPQPDQRQQTPQPQPPRQERPEPQPERESPRPAPQPRTVTQTVPTGTTFAIRMNEQLSTQTSRVGDGFTATLADPIVDADGAVIVPAGATVRGRVTAVSPSTRVGQTAVIKLAFEAISFGGESYPLQATVQRADVQQKTRTSAGESAGKVAVGAAAGAILGQVLGKNTESTLKGAAIGAAAGTAIAMGTQDVDAVLPQGAQVTIRLDQPIQITRRVAG